MSEPEDHLSSAPNGRPDGDAAAPDASSSNSGQAASPLGGLSRRRVLQLGAVAGIAAALAPLPRLADSRAFASAEANVPQAPNIIVLMTDQERHHMHWPAGWAEKNLPGLQRLKRHGLYFNSNT